MSAPLPIWVIRLVAEIEKSEDEHPKYYGDFVGGMQPLDQCPESRFLEIVPDSVRETARRWSA